MIDPDLWPWCTKNSSFTHETYVGTKYEDRKSNGSTFLRLWKTDGQILRKYIWISDCSSQNFLLLHEKETDHLLLFVGAGGTKYTTNASERPV